MIVADQDFPFHRHMISRGFQPDVQILPEQVLMKGKQNVVQLIIVRTGRLVNLLMVRIHRNLLSVQLVN